MRLYLSANLNMMFRMVLLAVLWVLRNMTLVLARQAVEGSSSSSWLFGILQEGNRWGKQPLQCRTPSLRLGNAKPEQVLLLIPHLQLVQGTNPNKPHPSDVDVFAVW